ILRSITCIAKVNTKTPFNSSLGGIYNHHFFTFEESPVKIATIDSFHPEIIESSVHQRECSQRKGQCQ
ncbi:MAG: hypothetical protein MZV64_29145, partial [Ignavibacteriales bacterium]|nr:hypothetical protein [Ignavibacteriales bacterium]